MIRVVATILASIALVGCSQKESARRALSDVTRECAEESIRYSVDASSPHRQFSLTCEVKP